MPTPRRPSSGRARRRSRRSQGPSISRPTAIRVRSCLGGVAVSGEAILHSETIYVQLSQGRTGPGHKILFRSVEGRTDYTGGPNNWASVDELIEPIAFAARIRRALRL